jgi:pyrroline-5-carboxylate reductase
VKNEKRFVKYDKELQIEAYWFQGILQKFPQHFHEYYVLGFVEKSGLRHMCYDNVDYYITAGDVLLFNPCVPHNCEPMDNDLLDLRCLNIKPEIMSQFMQELTGSEEVPLFASPVLRGDELSGSLLRELHQMIMQEREDLAKEETFYFLLEQLVAAGISFEQLAHDVVEPEMPMFRIVPNTAISELQSMTLIASRNAGQELEALMVNLFSEMGMAMILPEDKLEAATALTSCGIAYVLKYIQAAMQAGIEMGIRPSDAMDMIAQSVKGAAELILNNDTHPSVEIDKVTTPGGITIKGINELEHNGFTSAIIKAMKASR